MYYKITMSIALPTAVILFSGSFSCYMAF